MAAHDRFQEVVGEIGRDRREYLYEMSYCDILLIQRGYRRRNILQYQLQRLQAYGSMFCMSGTNKKPHEWMDLYFDHYKEQDAPPISEEEAAELVALIEEQNKPKEEGA